MLKIKINIDLDTSNKKFNSHFKEKPGLLQKQDTSLLQGDIALSH